MRTLVLGGIRSGKSQWAERAITESIADGAPVHYVATGKAPNADTVETIEVATQLRSATTTATLVDDIGGWLTATMDLRGAWHGASVHTDIDDLLDAVATFGAPLALVSPEVGLTVVPHTESGRRFADELGMLNQKLAARCDRVVLVVAGQPMTVKEPA